MLFVLSEFGNYCGFEIIIMIFVSKNMSDYNHEPRLKESLHIWGMELARFWWRLAPWNLVQVLEGGHLSHCKQERQVRLSTLIVFLSILCNAVYVYCKCCTCILDMLYMYTVAVLKKTSWLFEPQPSWSYLLVPFWYMKNYYYDITSLCYTFKRENERISLLIFMYLCMHVCLLAWKQWPEKSSIHSRRSIAFIDCHRGSCGLPDACSSIILCDGTSPFSRSNASPNEFHDGPGNFTAKLFRFFFCCCCCHFFSSSYYLLLSKKVPFFDWRSSI